MTTALNRIAGACAAATLLLSASGDAGTPGRAGLPPEIVVPLVTATLPLGLTNAQAGIVVASDGLIVTELRTVRSAHTLTVTLPGSSPLPARLVASDAGSDLALLKVAAPHLLPVPPFADSTPLQIGQSVRAYGYPFAESLGSRDLAEGEGTISRIAGPPVYAFFSDALVSPGFAGGPVLDTAGRVVGMMQVTAPGVRRTAWAKSNPGLLPVVERMRREPAGRAASPPSAAAVPPAPRLASRQITIAVNATLSGPSAAGGRAIRDGVQLAVEDLGAALRARGIGPSVIAADDRGDPAVAADNARRLAADPSVLLVVGHSLSGTSIAAAPVYDGAGLPMITPAGEVATLTDAGHGSVFRVIGRDDVQGVAAAQFVRVRLGGGSAYVVYEPSDYGLRTAAGFWWEGQRLGLRAQGLSAVDDTTLAQVVASIASAAPAVVYYGGEMAGAVPLLKRMREAGVRVPLIGADGLDTSEFAYLAGGAMLPAFYTVLDGPSGLYPGAGRFVERFRGRFGRPPEPFAALAFDAAGAGLQAIVAAGAGGAPDRAGVLAALHDPAFQYQGVTGMIRFTSNGDRVHSPVYVMEVRSPAWSRWRDNTVAAAFFP
ncbi:MAG TPA: ABC transporter substrate-binding protein [bacterium]|nr:ABC transporter substrate-binding protein [bacterium]